MHVFTSVTVNYIPKARVLAHSLKRHCPNYQFHLVLCDHLPESIQIENEPFDSIITVAELPISNIKSWLFKHSVVEMCTAVKGIAFQEIFQRHQCEKLIYLDPDIVVFDRLDRLSELLDRYSILLTPHQTLPEETIEAAIDNEICSLKHGVFNFGFLGVRHSEEGNKFLNWWAQRCQEFCYDDIPGGLFTDQRWGDLIPAFFTDYYVLRDPIYNVATWNLTHRIATGSLESGILINNEPLCFYHFSGFDSGAQEEMLKKYGSKSPILFELRQWYIAQCQKMEQDKYGKQPCVYSFFDNGEPITQTQRKIYRDRWDLQKAFPDPYSASSTNSYFHWLTIYEKAEYPDPSIELLECHQMVSRLELQLKQAEETIEAMQSSKFWKLKKVWLRLRKITRADQTA